MSSITLDPAIKAHIVLAASIIAGNGASETDVNTEVRRIASRLSEGSAALNVLSDLDRRDENTVKTKGFPATILHVDREKTSTRGVVFLKTKPSKFHPNGKEIARTERTDSEDGKAIAKLAQSLVGHNVYITVGVEATGDVNVRVIRSIEDKGIAEGFDPELPDFKPGFESEKSTLAKLQSAAAAQARAELGVAEHS